MAKLERTEHRMLESSQKGAAHFHKLSGVAQKQRDFEQAFIDKYVDPDTGRVFASQVRARQCPICGDSTGRSIFVKNGFQHLRCQCGMIYVPEILKDDFNLPYSGKNQEKETHDAFRDRHRAAFIHSVYERGARFLQAYGVSDGKLLDIGCSSGMFMEYAASLGYDVTGLEPSGYAAGRATQRGLKVVCGKFPATRFPEASFDIITLWDVLEHVENPLSLLRAAFRSLVTGGTLFFQVPNAASLAATILREKCNMFNGYGHINLFSPNSVRALTTKAGFLNVEMKTVITEFSVVENHLNFDDPYLGPSTGCKKLWGLLSASDLHRKHMGYKLQVAATAGNV